MKYSSWIFLGFATISMMPYPPVQAASSGTIAIHGELQAIGCTLEKSDGGVDVPLTSVNLTDLQQTDEVAGKTGFTIGLTCYSKTQVGITLTSSHADSYGKGTLTNSSGDDRASGIAVQVLDSSGNPITIGQTFSVIDSAVDGENNVQLYAQYIRTSDKASGGSINTTADYTLSYD